jgi:hypothetical protein
VRFTFHIPKANPEREKELIDQQWVKLKEPRSILTTILISVPFMVLAGGFTFMISQLFEPVGLKDYGFEGSTVKFNIHIFYIIAIFFLLLIHEVIHLIMIPNFMKSKKTWMGIQFFGGFVFTEEIMSRERFILISLAPYAVISVILPLIFGAIGWLNPVIIFLLLLNALGSSVDLLNLILLLVQAPRKANLICVGMSTFWKHEEVQRCCTQNQMK